MIYLGDSNADYEIVTQKVLANKMLTNKILTGRDLAMSLNLRIILSATLVLVIFITLTAAALDRAFFESTESALRDKLTSQLYSLMAAAEVDDSGILMPSSELDALLGLPSSGVYAFITSAENNTLWKSSSSLGATPPLPISLKTGEKRFRKISVSQKEYFTFTYGVNWATQTGNIPLTFNLTTDLASFNKQINQYRKTLWGWLLAMALLLLISQAAILRWGLSPLRKVGAELNLIEAGEQEKIEDTYPQEIDRLTTNINSLLLQERQQKSRYRNALGDLAHSLKTPLAVLQSGINEQKKDAMLEQVSRMNAIVEYQLQRAATAGSSNLSKSVNVGLIVNRMLESLQKVYRDKPVTLNMDIDETLLFKGDEGDLMELLGNLLDNAFKWASQHIDINVQKHNNKLLISVSDDGPGIAPDQADELLKRGVRADQTSAGQATAGHGIGLSIVGNIIDAYNGEIHISKSALGGAKISLIL